MILTGDWVYDPILNVVGVVKTHTRDWAFVYLDGSSVSTKYPARAVNRLKHSVVARNRKIYENSEEILILAERRARILEDNSGFSGNLGVKDVRPDILRRFQ